ncbi:MAG: hypothetical protein JWP89_5827 [Schlesneria sp.]|nr:hypothetical protein [Schlesneria sp.]
MATFDQAFPAAVQELDERGLLLNVHLVRLVDGDQQLLRTIREALITDGLAQDRYGVGLAKSADFDVQRATHHLQRPAQTEIAESPDEIVFAGESQKDADWWLMSGGATSGPYSLDALIQMRRLGDVSDNEMVRQGAKGMWLIPKDIAELADISPAKRTITKKATASAPTLSTVVAPTVAPDISRQESRTRQPVVERNAVVPTVRQSVSVTQQPNFETGIEYFLWDAGKSIGPVDRQELQARLDSGRLEAGDFVQAGRNGDWQPLSLALGASRPPLQIPQSALNAIKGELSDFDVAAMPALSRSATPQAPIQVVKQGQPKSSKPAARQIVELPESPIIRGWVQAGQLVGGQSRLWAIVVVAACSIAVVIWLRQPPSAGVIYQELAATHKKISEGRRIQPGSNKPIKVSSEDLERVVAIKNGLAKRAAANRPAIQELLWACEYGLVPLLEQPYGSKDLERIFADHMGRAERLIDPAKITPDQAPVVEPSQTVTE